MTDDIKANDVKPADTKPAETKPVSPPDAKEAPAAMPAVKPAPAEPLPFTTATAALDIGNDYSRGHPDLRLSQAPGLQEVPDSPVPGRDRSHVMGPGQSAVDPVAAGLDTQFVPLSAAENRAVTLTGEVGSGNPGSVSDGVTVAAKPDSAHAMAPGPNGAA